jgi:hypothetical protein
VQLSRGMPARQLDWFDARPATARMRPSHTGGKSPTFRRERTKSRETRTLHWSEPASNSRSPGRHPASLSVAVTFPPDCFLRREIRRGEMSRCEISLVSRGTDGSNPASSSEESVANSILGATGGIISAVQVQPRPSRSDTPPDRRKSLSGHDCAIRLTPPRALHGGQPDVRQLSVRRYARAVVERRGRLRLDLTSIRSCRSPFGGSSGYAEVPQKSPCCCHRYRNTSKLLMPAGPCDALDMPNRVW